MQINKEVLYGTGYSGVSEERLGKVEDKGKRQERNPRVS